MIKEHFSKWVRLSLLGWACVWALAASVVCGIWLSGSAKEVGAVVDDLKVSQCASVIWLENLNGCHGMAQLELPRDVIWAQTALDKLAGSNHLNAAIENVERDYVFILAYAAFLCLWSIHTSIAAFRSKRKVLGIVLLVVAFLQPAAGVLDGLENIGLFALLDPYRVSPAHIDPAAVSWTLTVSTIKWWLVGLGVVAPPIGWLWIGAMRLFKGSRQPARVQAAT